MRPVALVSARAARALDEDLAPLQEALHEQGVRAEVVDWDDAAVVWSGYACAVLRSTWDYVPRLAEFMTWLQRVSVQTTLLNPPDLVRWNIDKRYLRDLAAQGVPVVPTRYVEPHERAEDALQAFLRESGGAEFVVKPTVGAGSKDTARYPCHDPTPALAHLGALLRAGRGAMLQPYLRDVDDYGETAMVYLGGLFSHAIRKAPLLQPRAGFPAGLFAAERISSRQPSKEEGRVAKKAFNAIAGETPLYARIDLVRDDALNPVVLELELAEPSLFFHHAPEAAPRLARAITARLLPNPP